MPGKAVRYRRTVGLVTLVIIAAFACAALCSCSLNAKQSSQSTPNTKYLPSTDVVLSQNQWGDYFEHMDQSIQTWAQGFAAENVDKLKLNWYMEGGIVRHEYTDAQSITGAFNALAMLSLDEKTDAVTEDNSYSVCFIMKDGSECAFIFNDKNARVGNKDIYTLKNTDGIYAVFALARDTDTAIWD